MLDLFSRSLRITIDKIIYEQRNILFAVAQRRQFDRKNIEQVVKIIAKGTVRDSRLQITIRRRDNADISAQNFRAAHAFKLAFLQNAQQCDLRLHWQISYFVEKNRAAFRQFESTQPPLNCPSKCSFFVTKQLRHDERRRNRGAIHTDERTLRTLRPFVNGAGDQFLPCARFTHDQNGGICRGDLGCARQDHLQGRGRADHFFKHRSLTELFTERDVLFSYFFFRPFAIFDVRGCAVPSRYVSAFIFERSLAEQKPTKLTVVPQQSSFEFIGHPTWLAPLLQSDAKIFERCLIDVESASIRRKYTDVLRRQIQNLPKLCFLFADSLFRNFALFNFNTRAIPFDDLSRFVAQRFLTMKEPAIFPVSPPHARLANERLSGFKRHAPFGHKRFYILRMDHAGPAPPQQICQRETDIFQPAAVEEVNITIRQRGV